MEVMHVTPLLKRLDGEVDSNAMVMLSKDELSMNTGSPRPSPIVGSLLAKNSPYWVGGLFKPL
jgi:hypothetical protein